MPKVHDAESTEVLMRLWELCDRYSRAEVLHLAASEAYQSESHRHRILYGHALTYGCCKDADPVNRRLNDSLRQLRSKHEPGHPTFGTQLKLTAE